MYNPWAELGRLTEWRLVFAPLKGDRFGATNFTRHLIVLDSALTTTQRRCSLAHELVHVERGPIAHIPVLDEREEAVVRAIAARRLIAIGDLEDAVRWGGGTSEVCERLWVTRTALEERLSHLRPAERAHLQGLVGEWEGVS